MSKAFKAGHDLQGINNQISLLLLALRYWADITEKSYREPSMRGSPADHHCCCCRLYSKKVSIKKGKEIAHSTRKHCNCKNSRCLKLYCECFASGRYCSDCNCVSCCNNQENESFRQAAVETILDRNPNAFRPKIQVCLLLSSLARGYPNSMCLH